MRDQARINRSTQITAEAVSGDPNYDSRDASNVSVTFGDVGARTMVARFSSRVRESGCRS